MQDLITRLDGWLQQHRPAYYATLATGVSVAALMITSAELASHSQQTSGRSGYGRMGVPRKRYLPITCSSLSETA